MDRLSSFERCWWPLFRLLIALQRSLLRIDKASLFETFGSLKIRNSGYTAQFYNFLDSTIYNFSRKIINIYNDIAQKYGNFTVKDFQKHEKLEYKKNKLKLNINFFNNCKQLDLHPKFLIFKLLNVSNKDALSICKRLLRSTINKRNKELDIFQKNSVYPNTFYLHRFLLLTSTSLQNL